MMWRLIRNGNLVRFTDQSPPGSIIIESDSAPEVAMTIADDTDHRVLVLDIPESDRLGDSDSRTLTEVIARHPLPVVGAMPLRCTGQALALALRADVRIAAVPLEVRIPPIAETLRYGLVASLAQVVGPGIAGYWAFARPPISGQAALTWGLVHELVSFDGLERRVAEVAESIAQNSPLALRYAKEAVHRGRSLPLPAALELEADLYSLLQQSSDRAEGITAYLEGRDPEFTGE